MKIDIRDTVSSQTRASLRWSAIERFSVQALQFGVTIVLARLLAPRDYGVIAALYVFISLAQIIVESGFTSALIQKGNADHADFSTAFHVNVVLAVGLYLLLFLAAPLIAAFFAIPEITVLCRWLGLVLVIQAPSLVHTAKLTLAIDFKTQAKVSLLSAGLGGAICISLALNGVGAWAIVFQTLAASLVSSLMLWHVVPWRPSAVFSRESFRSLSAFGSRLLVSSLIATAYLNMYNLAIGRRFSSEQLGYYTQSNFIARFASINLMAIVTRATYPILCRHKDDLLLVRQSFLKVLRLSCFLLFPLLCGLAALAKPVVALLLTETWAPMSGCLAILSLAHVVIPITVMNNQLLMVRGHADLFLKAEIIKKCAGVLILLATLPFGITWVVAGIFFYNVVDTIVMIGFTRKIFGFGYLVQLREIAVFLMMACFAGVAANAASSVVSGAIYQVLLGASVGVLIYFIIAEVLGIDEFRDLKHQLFHRRFPK